MLNGSRKEMSSRDPSPLWNSNPAAGEMKLLQWVLQTNSADWGELRGLITSLPSALLTTFPPTAWGHTQTARLHHQTGLYFPEMLAFGTFDFLKRSRECITVKLSSGLEDKWQTLASFSLERQRAKDKRRIFLLCLQLYALIDFNAIKKKNSDFKWQARFGQARTSKQYVKYSR